MALPKLSAHQPIAGSLPPTRQFLEFMEKTRAAQAMTDEEQQAILDQLAGLVSDLTAVVDALSVQVDRITRQTISTSYANGLAMAGLADGATAKITISAHTRVYTDSSVAVLAGELTGLDYNKAYAIFYDDPDREGGAVAYQRHHDPAEAVTSSIHPFRHLVGVVITPADGSAPPSSGGGSRPPGFPPGDEYEQVIEL